MHVHMPKELTVAPPLQVSQPAWVQSMQVSPKSAEHRPHFMSSGE